MSLSKKLSNAAKLWREEHYRLPELLSVFTTYLPDEVLSFKPRFVLALETPSLPAGGRSGVAVRLATRADVQGLVSLSNKPNEFMRRFGKNHFCIAAEIGARMVGYYWCHLGPLHYEPDLKYWFRAGTRAVWCYDAYVDPLYRRKGIWKGIQTGIISFLGDSHDFWAIVDYTNSPSLKAHLKYGFRIAQQSIHVFIMGVRFVFQKAPSHTDLIKIYRKLSLPSSAAASGSRAAKCCAA